MVTAMEWLGCLLGVLGAGILALNNRWSGYGFVLFLGSNAAWIAFGLLTGTMGLVTMQIVFTATSLVGIWQWLIRPRVEARRAARSKALASLRSEVTKRAYTKGRQAHGYPKPD